MPPWIVSSIPSVSWSDGKRYNYAICNLTKVFHFHLLCTLCHMEKIAVFPGSFDPITSGHVDLVRRALPLFDKLVVAIGINSQKKSLFSLDQRLQWLHDVFGEEPKVEVGQFENLPAHYCRRIGASYLLRGLRNASDFDYEKTISQLNQIVGDGLETIFLIAQPGFSHISSTIVREIIKGGGDASPFLPEQIQINSWSKL